MKVEYFYHLHYIRFLSRGQYMQHGRDNEQKKQLKKRENCQAAKGGPAD